MRYSKLIIITIIVLLSSFISVAQQKPTYDEADIFSYNLYLNGKWKELLDYGKTSINQGQDFIYLRLRMGYAAFMLQNYSEALKHYNQILSKDRYNENAHYYAWACLLYLQQTEQANIHVPDCSKQAISTEHIKKSAIRELGLESSYKVTDVTTRDNSFYNKINLITRLGWKINMEHSFITYNQNINEKALINVQNNQQIVIHQKEYYNKTTFSIDNKLQLKFAFHYIKTPFNSLNTSPFTNIVYENNLALIGLKYLGDYFTLQGSFIAGKIIDTTINQFNFQATYFPKGNFNFYGISTLSIQNRGTVQTPNLQQVIGCKLNKTIWMELNGTFGKFSNYTENDLLYVYNAIDENHFKGGMNMYLNFNKNVLTHVGYTFEKRKLYNTNILFYQHSINGGITWKF